MGIFPPTAIALSELLLSVTSNYSIPQSIPEDAFEQNPACQNSFLPVTCSSTQQIEKKCTYRDGNNHFDVGQDLTLKDKIFNDLL